MNPLVLHCAALVVQSNDVNERFGFRFGFDKKYPERFGTPASNPGSDSGKVFKTMFNCRLITNAFRALA